MTDEATFYEDWVAALNAMPKVGRDETVDTGTYSYTYATLSNVIDQVRKVLAQHNLALSQDVKTTDGMVEVFTQFHHTSGESIQFGPLAFATSKDPKAVGSAITYARRYQLTAALGIAPDEDDDGTRAAERATVQYEEPEGPRPSEWLANRVQMFKEWNEEERKLAYSGAMEALEIERFQTQDHAEAVFEWMKDAYYDQHPPPDDEAPF